MTVTSGLTGTLWLGLLLTLAGWGTLVPQSHAQGAVSEPAQVVDQYLSSLVTGDTGVLSTLIDGHMKRRNRQLALDPASYGVFLRNHYNGARTTVEEIAPRGEHLVARVRFDFPASDASVVELVLTRVGSQWKITDELY